MYLEVKMEAKGYSLLLIGLQQEAEASCCEAMAWEATFEDGLPPEQWHEGRAFDCLVRQAMLVKKASEYRSRGWRHLLSASTLPSTLEREPGHSLLSERNHRPLSVSFNEQRRVAALLYEKRKEREEEQLELFQQQLEQQELEELDQQQEQQQEGVPEMGFFERPFVQPPPPTEDLVYQFISSGQ